MALAVMLIALGGVGAWAGFAILSDRTQVLTVVAEVPAGETITAKHLGQANVALGPGVEAVPFSERDTIVGMRAKTGLEPGSLLTRGQVTDQPVVRKGEQVVPVGLKPALVPASRLSPGQVVQIVNVPDPNSSGGADGRKGGRGAQDRELVTARVVALGEPQPGSDVRVLDVAVAAEDGPTVAAWSAQGAVAVTVGGE
ncbi:flagella basal body P-ring formation protein FlgA [Streptomyces alkaliterrae]|nr:flagella basal body P-ring formation protein FlgA [Streptomyces alkaliterrae]